RAEALAVQVLDIERTTVGNTHPNFAAALSHLGRIYSLMGRYDEAESLYQQALQIRTAFGASHPDLAHTLSNMAELYRTRGDYAKALSLQQQALAIRRAAYGEHHVDVAQSLNNLALVYEAMGDYGAAEPLYGQALQILRRAVGERHPNVALALNNLAAFYFAKGDYAAAESLHQQALVLTKAIYGERHHEVARSLSNLAAVYRVQGRFGEARALYGQAVEISEETLGRDHPIHSRYLNNLSELHLATGDYAAAEPLFTRALAVRRRALGERHPDVATVLYNLAALYAATGREAEAMVLMQQAVDLDTMMVSHVFSTAAESQRMAYLDLLRWRLDVFLSLVVSHASSLAAAAKTGLDLVLARKGLGAEVLATQRDAVLSGQYPRLEPIVRELAALRARMARKTLAGPGAGDLPSHEQQLAEWNTRKEELELSLARQIPDVQLERQLRVADAETVALALPPETTLVEFVRFALYNFAAVPAAAQSRWGPARYIAFVVPAGEPQSVQMVDLGEADVIDERIAAWRSALTREAPRGTPGVDWPAERDLRGETGTLRGALRAAMQSQSDWTDRPERAPDQDEGSRLREAILDPLLPLLAGRTRLILAPDGDLGRVPFEALPLPDDGYIIDGYRIQYVSTGRDVLRFGR
ncbi:MAG: tetratricopeptide repeat protein, partial [Armatimonadota bacterium]